MVWHEGLFLRPQHLQQQERYIHHLIEERSKSMRPFNWGLTEIELDPQLLKLGKISITNAQGVFSDGTPFDIPHDTPSPIPYEVAKDTKETLIYLAVPLIQPNALLMANNEDNNSLARHSIKDIQVPDLHTGQVQGDADVQVGELNVKLLTEQIQLNAYSIIPVARIVEIAIKINRFS